MKGKRMIAWLLSTAMLAGMMPVTSFAEGTLPYANHQEDAADCGFTENDPCRHEIHTRECYTEELICSVGENTASDSDADLPHEHTLNCYLLNCPHERGIHTSETSGNENTSKATDSDAVELLMDIEPYEIAGEGYTFDEDAGELSISNNDGTTAWKNNSNITSASI